MEIKRPWREPGYTGKLKATPDVMPSPGIRPKIDDLIECTLDMLIKGILTQEKANRLLTHYDKFKKDGYYLAP